MKQVRWKKVDDMYIAEFENHIAQDEILIKAIEKAVKFGESEKLVKRNRA